MTLTIDTIMEAVRKIQNLGPPRLKVVVAHHLPRPIIYERIEVLRAHPYWIWWRRLWGDENGWFVMWMHWPVYGEPDAYRVGDTLYVSPTQAAALRAREAENG